MKINFTTLSLLYIFLIISSCSNKSQDYSEHDVGTTTDDGNEVLYNQVMDIHNEVMPKTEDLYNISKGLKAMLKEAKTDEEKKQLEMRIAYLDSVNNMMMDWMHEFQPLPDTANEERVRAYYETNLEKVRRIKEAILMAIEKEEK